MKLLLVCVAFVALAGMCRALSKEVNVHGRYRPQSAHGVSPMANITNYLGYMVFKNLPDKDKIVSPISVLEVLFMLYFGESFEYYVIFIPDFLVWFDWKSMRCYHNI